MTGFFHIDDLSCRRAGTGKVYFEFLRVPAMSAGVYVLPEGGTDRQKPHHEDEMYYVVRGRARVQVGSPITPRCDRAPSFSSRRTWSIASMTSRKNSKFWFSSPRRNGSEFGVGRARACRELAEGTPGAPLE